MFFAFRRLLTNLTFRSVPRSFAVCLFLSKGYPTANLLDVSCLVSAVIACTVVSGPSSPHVVPKLRTRGFSRGCVCGEAVLVLLWLIVG